MQSTEKDSRFLKKWTVTRQHKWRYIFVNFVLLWGVFAVIASYIISQYLNFSDASFSLTDMVIRIMFFILIGFVIGNVQFEGMEKRYLELKKQQPDH